MKGVGCAYNGGVTSGIYFMHNYFFLKPGRVRNERKKLYM